VQQPNPQLLEMELRAAMERVQGLRTEAAIRSRNPNGLVAHRGLQECIAAVVNALPAALGGSSIRQGAQ